MPVYVSYIVPVIQTELCNIFADTVSELYDFIKKTTFPCTYNNHVVPHYSTEITNLNHIVNLGALHLDSDNNYARAKWVELSFIDPDRKRLPSI